MATSISYTHTYCGMGMRDANISPGMRDDNSSPYICEIIYICEMGKRDDNIHMKRYCNVYVYVYVYLCTSVYIGLCLCVHICVLIAGCFTICICEIGLFLFSKANTNTKYCHHTVHKSTAENPYSRCNFNYQAESCIWQGGRLG